MGRFRQFHKPYAGNYNVQIRDAVNTACVAVLDGAADCNRAAGIDATVNRTNITCFGSTDGTIRYPAQQAVMGLTNTASTAEVHGRQRKLYRTSHREPIMSRSAMLPLQVVILS